MRKKLLFAVAVVFFFAMAVYSPREASAIPAFARQTGFACSTCHYQHFPELNAFGRAFKAGGFTQVGGESLIEGEGLSIPATLNATLITKLQYNNTWGNNTAGQASQFDHGTWSFPTDDSLFIAGRAGEHIGFLTEIGLTSPAGVASLKVPFTFNAYDTTFDIIPFSTGAGPSWSFEVLNTGIVETHTALLHKPETFAANYIGASQDATGVAFVAYKPWGYANYALWENNVSGFTQAAQHISSPLQYLRLALTPQLVSGWDIGFGGAGWFGGEKYGALDAPTVDHASAWALDAQAQGNVMDHPVGIYASYAQADKSSATSTNMFNPGDKTMNALTVLAEVGIIPNKLSASAGYRFAHNGDPDGSGRSTMDNATTLALLYNPMLNVQFGIEHSWYAGSGLRSEESASGYISGTTPAIMSGPGQLTTITMWAAF